MKAHYSTQPPVLQNQNNGSWLYNFEIESITVTDPLTATSRTQWQCGQVTIWGEVTKKKAKKAIIESEYANDDEKKLINDYQAWGEGSLTDEKYRDNYLAFLSRRKTIKEMVTNETLIPVNE